MAVGMGGEREQHVPPCPWARPGCPPARAGPSCSGQPVGASAALSAGPWPPARLPALISFPTVAKQSCGECRSGRGAPHPALPLQTISSLICRLPRAVNKARWPAAIACDRSGAPVLRRAGGLREVTGCVPEASLRWFLPQTSFGRGVGLLGPLLQPLQSSSNQGAKWLCWAPSATPE